MKFTKLRLVGFKSFVEPTELLISSGLTGVVGPNGCGKSNLVEALRWVMGETSYKNMRGSQMDDVIFAGSTKRPARDTAEVTLSIDNSQRKASAEFNVHDQIDVSRKIERESGSVYRVNGKSVRARDVQILFADASSGARSSALIQQGQIGEMIRAKPEQRRKILEEAAGISGLDARRHEATLKLKQTETNIERIQDVVNQLDGRLKELSKQAKEADKYKKTSQNIRLLQAFQAHLNWSSAKQEGKIAKEAKDNALDTLAKLTSKQAEAARLFAVAEHEIEPIRKRSIDASARLGSIKIEEKRLDDEENLLKSQIIETARRVDELNRDIDARENEQKEASTEAERLIGLAKEQKETIVDPSENVKIIEGELQDVDGEISSLNEQITLVVREAANYQATLNTTKKQLSDKKQSQGQLEKNIANEKHFLDKLNKDLENLNQTDDISSLVDQINQKISEAETDLLELERTRHEAETNYQAQRAKLADIEAEFKGLQAEEKSLRSLVQKATKSGGSPLIDGFDVPHGYEKALAAAFGEELDVEVNESGDVYWVALNNEAHSQQIENVEAVLGDIVSCTSAGKRKLDHVGLVNAQPSVEQIENLSPGQSLVDRAGNLWRWDGYVRRDSAPNPGAVRLETQNQLTTVENNIASLQVDLKAQTEAFEQARHDFTQLEKKLKDKRYFIQQEKNQLKRKEDDYKKFEMRRRDIEQNIIRKSEKIDQFEVNLQEVLREVGHLSESYSELEKNVPDQEKESAMREHLKEFNQKKSELLSSKSSLVSAYKSALARIEELERTALTWQNRVERMISQSDNYKLRLEDANQQQISLKAKPAELKEKRRVLLNHFEEAEAFVKTCDDDLAVAQSKLTATSAAAQEMQKALSEANTDFARMEERLAQISERIEILEKEIFQSLTCRAHELAQKFDFSSFSSLDMNAVEERLSRLKLERERLGGVNLRADIELKEGQAERDKLEQEAQDLQTAVDELRNGISQLNKEARAKLSEAFEEVNKQFQILFTKLFGGGKAELTFVGSSDPLEAGLDMIAHPPGKKPQSMSLLSGGEQALSALSLVFALFMSNPAPLCVLDEVDAPLDDANIERFCDLVVDIEKQTGTRFLVITHNPITMTQMDRLFGVTMAERGVSKLVSVDLKAAEAILETEST